MEDTIFSKILNGQIKTDFIYEDEYCVAFHDIAPQAPVHFLVIPKTPYIDIKEATKDSTLAGHSQDTLKGIRLAWSASCRTAQTRGLSIHSIL